MCIVLGYQVTCTFTLITGIKHYSSEDFNGNRLYVTRARESFLERLQRERQEAQQKEAEKVPHFALFRLVCVMAHIVFVCFLIGERVLFVRLLAQRKRGVECA